MFSGKDWKNAILFRYATNETVKNRVGVHKTNNDNRAAHLLKSRFI